MTNTTGNPFQNYSGPAGLNRGGNGKFTPSQTQERYKVHAISLALGTPTLAQIIGIWKEKFDIDITIPSEKEWRNANREQIEKKKLELVEDGTIALPVVSEATLSDSLLNTTITTARLLKDVQKKTKQLLSTLNVDKDGGTDKFKDRVTLFRTYANVIHQLNKDFTDQTTKLFEMSAKINIKDKQIQKIVDEKFEQRLSAAQDEDDEVDPMEIEITDAMREKLKVS